MKHLVSVIDLKRSNELVSKVRELLVELNATDHEKVALGAALMSLGIDGCQDCSEDMAYKVLRGMFEGEDWLN